MSDHDLIGGASIHDTPLYRALYRGLPNHRSERFPTQLDCYKIARELNISHQAVYKWLGSGELPAKRVKQLIALDGSTLRANHLIQFVTD